MIQTRNHIVRSLRSLALCLPLQIFRPIECLLLQFFSTPNPNVPSIFIISLPRCGSTLTYQCFSDRFVLNYFTNFSHFFFRLPLLSNYISFFLLKTFSCPSSFVSSRGFVSGLLGHAEGFVFWHYWMNAGLNESDLSYSIKSCTRPHFLCSVFTALNAFTQTPFLSAYLGHLLCLPQLSRTFPSAIFIRLHRAPLMTALSLYRCLNQSDSDWVSLFPKECFPYCNESNAMKVASQVYWLLKRLDTLSLHSQNVFDVSYERICENPELVMTDFKLFCKRRGVELIDRFPLPDGFSCRSLNDAPLGVVMSIKYCFRLLVLRHGLVDSLKLTELI